MPTNEKALERVLERMRTLSDLQSRGIVQGNLFRKQIHSLLSSRDTRLVFSENIEPDRKAIKILKRLEDPAGWRENSMKSLDQRMESFFDAIEDILSDEGPEEAKLFRILQLGCLPFYSGFMPFNGKSRDNKEHRTSRVSVLD